MVNVCEGNVQSFKVGASMDNGGSEVRVLDCQASLDDILKLDNDFVKIREEDFRIKEVAEPARLCRILEAPNEEMKGIISQGLTGKAYDAQAITISSQSQKTSNINYYRQVVFALAQNALQNWLKLGGYSRYSSDCSASKGLLQATIFEYAVAICIPVREYNGVKDCADILKNTLAGTYTVEFPLLENSPRLTFELKKENIGVLPEGGVAISALKRDLGEDEISLLIDMGHLTADIAVFQGTTLLGKVISSQFAGSTLLANVRMALADEGYILSEKQVETVLETKKVRNGKTDVDVTSILELCIKRFVSNYLQKDVVQVLNANAINVKQVQNFVPLGAPMNNPASNPLIAEIVECCGLENSEVKLLPGDLRYVNVVSANNFAKLLLKRMKA
ncbi:MAG: hypothetical protein IJE43_19525 [Alphaproteobacteria bacterium]|nr:hypothetical protein [Alphaproteobacteria bacterium]